MGTWIVGAIIACILALAIYKLIKDRKSGKNCSGCDSCGDRGTCRPDEKK